MGEKEIKKMGNRFENLDENHGITLLKFSYNGTEFKIRTTDHSFKRFKENGINVDIACGDVIALGKERLYNYAKTGGDVAIIDVENQMTTIITFEGTGDNSQIRIRTIIPKSNVWIRKGTGIYNIGDKI